MATSGSVSYSRTALQLIEKAFRIIGVKDKNQDLEADEIQDGIEAINFMFKTWMVTPDMHLWTQEEGVLFTQTGKTDYLIGPSGDHATTLDDFVGTDITTAAVITATTLVVTSTAGMTAGDQIGIELDDLTRQWTTIVTVDSSTGLTITAALTAAAAVGNTIFTYTTISERPLRVSGARRKTYGLNDEIEAREWSRSDYFDQVGKESQGTIINWYYSPLLTNGRMYTWLTSTGVNKLLRFSFERSIEDVLSQTNNVDFPVEWYETIVYNLAARLLDDYDAPLEKASAVIEKAGYLLEAMKGWDQENVSIRIVLRSGRGRR